jgi:hypothetical protein
MGPDMQKEMQMCGIGSRRVRREARRKVSGVVTALVVCGGTLATPVQAASVSWNAGSGSWMTVANWLPNDVPDADDLALIGNFAFVENLAVYLDASDTIGGLEVTDGMTLSLDGERLAVLGDALVSGSNQVGAVVYRSRIWVENSGAAAPDFACDGLTIDDGGMLWMRTGSHVEVNDGLEVLHTGALSGEGLLHLKGNAFRALDNEGVINPSTGGLIIVQLGNGRVDLDGASGSGEVHAAVAQWRDRLPGG